MRKRLVWWFSLLALCVVGQVSVLAYQRVRVALRRALDDFLNNYINDDINYDYYEDLPEGLSVRSKRRLSATVMRKLRDVMNGRDSTRDARRDRKLVLFWTSWFSKAWWVRVGGGVDLEAAHCPETRCYFTHDRRRREEAAAVLFLSAEVTLSDLPFSRSPGQRWVWVHVEAPTSDVQPHAASNPRLLRSTTKSANVSGHRLDNLFNWTMTYHPASSIMEPYGALIPRENYTHSQDALSSSATRGKSSLLTSLRPALLDTNSRSYEAYMRALHGSETFEEIMGPSWVPYVDWATEDAGKDWSEFLERPKLVAWMSSHCQTRSRREDYVKQLQEHVYVHVYGACGALSCGRRKSHRKDRCWQDVLARRYLFYLAFENSMCDAYVTEKLWKPLVHGVVPIVLGGANYSQYLPPNSYINALEYQPRELALLLRQLQASPRDYGRFHLWRAFWRATLRPPLCELCLKIHNDDEVATLTKIPDWWREVGQCHNPAVPTTLL
ncbi:alpha-(1,3)-fucosyltransferase C-like [Penaeus japonicus]|uniref:alpha-(1,3)-fucosyltransferase C-like n=1 Tax=Penaeus japonicus TaxID=27405 RepID=UPI001C70B44F|nr:alpha-(1,3)-fucosyltransferase C-like [Penaeus japonicus]XP_042881468.1 alpha-(1,3)-fucosyltransferase C-like [Penaeus japonicus]